MKYDKDAKMQRLVDAVGELLLERGHQAIGINQVAAQAGVSKPMIYDYFGSLNELVKAYIRKKDYWMPFFEGLELPDAGDREDLQAFFTVTLQEEFLYFFREAEMQRLILWQISTVSPLMRSISETREREGQKLLALADPYFRGSGISFRAVSALIVGGIYYLVLHAVYNKSTVCGIDVNQQEDRTILLKTIGALVSLAWQKATNETIDPNTIPMNNEPDVMSAMAAALAAKNYAGERADPPDAALALEAGRLGKAIEKHVLSIKNDTQLSSYINLMLQKLIAAADVLYRIAERPSAETAVVLELVSKIRKLSPRRAYGKLRLPLAFVAELRPRLEARWLVVAERLAGLGADPLLAELVHLPLADIRPDNELLHWDDHIWLKRYFKMLEAPDWEVSEEVGVNDLLVSRLIRLDFNHQRFLAYCYRGLKARMQQLPLKRDKLEELHRRRALFIQDSALSFRRYDHHSEPVVRQLCNWIDAEMALIREIEPEDRVDPKANPHKFNYKINAAGIAVWLKLQNDHGLLDEKVDDLSVKIAYNCSSIGQAELSEASQRSKFYSKDEKVIRPLVQHMEEMLTDLKRMI